MNLTQYYKKYNNVNWKRRFVRQYIKFMFFFIRDNTKRKCTGQFIQAFTFANDILYHMNDGISYILLRAIY